MTPRLERVGKALVFIHPCEVCGNPVAPFGTGVRLRSAIEARDATKAGRWFCREHWEKGEIDGEPLV